MNKPDIVIWRETPIDVDLKTYEYIAENWGSKVKCYYFDSLSSERVKTGFSIRSAIYSQKIDLSNINELLNNELNAIHIISGFSSNMRVILKKIKKNKIDKVVIIAEKPYLYCSFIKKILHNMYINVFYRYLAFKYKNTIQLFLAMGKDGVSKYVKLGWPKEKVCEYMYCSGNNANLTYNNLKDIIKFVYIGRMNKEFKGVDLLLNALDKIPEGKWSFDFIGDYGELVDDVKKLSLSKKNIYFLGSVEQNHLYQVISNYDCCVVPSRSEGWNLNVNHAINCGLSIIATKESVSGEILNNCDCGIFVKDANAVEIEKAITYVINNRDKIEIWKKNSLEFSKNISKETVGCYFIELILYYLLKEKKDIPYCPWNK